MSAKSSIGVRRLWLPVATVIGVLIISLAVPFFLRRAELANRRDLQRTIYPLRTVLQDQMGALQSGVAARAGYAATNNPEMLDRAAGWIAVVDSLTPQIHEMLDRSPEGFADAYDELEGRRIRMGQLRPTAGTGSDTLYEVLPQIDALQDSVLDAYHALDLLITSEIIRREDRLDELEQTGEISNLLLGILGLLAVVSVARLARAENQARRSAEEAVGLRDQVVSIVSHDLRNPLNTIGLAAGFLLVGAEEAGADQTVRQLNIIQRAAMSMNRMIRDLLDVAQIESGQLSIARSPADLAEVLEEALSILRPVVEEKGIAIDTQIPASLPHVLIDSERTAQILSNLVGNAAKFTPEGGTISIRAERAERFVWIEVADTGSGIPAENIPHLFDRFWQANRSDRRGIGLGLPIVKHLVDAQGGQIEVTSVVGEGSVFRFSAPLA